MYIRGKLYEFAPHGTLTFGEKEINSPEFQHQKVDFVVEVVNG